MKHVFFISLLLLFMLSGLHAQTRYVRNIPIDMPSPDYFEYQYTPKQIFSCPDGGVIILGDIRASWGEYPFPNTAADCGAVKLDANGYCEWQWLSRNFSGWGTPHIMGIDQDPDGRVNFLINVSGEYSQIGWIDPTRHHSLQYIPILNCNINRAMRLTDNTIFAIGNISVNYNLNHWRSHAFFLHLNADGDTLSTRDYPPDTLWISYNSYGALAFDMELDTDGMPVSSCIFTDIGASAVKTDWDGNILWRRDTHNQITNQITDGLLRPIPITKIPSTNDLVFGYTAYNNELNNQFSVYKVSDVGLDSLYTIQLTESTCVGSYYSIVGYEQGIYLSGDFGDYLYPNDDTILFHISDYTLTGQQAWTWTADFLYAYNMSTDCIAVLPDGCLMDVFGTFIFSNGGLTVIKLTPEGSPNDDDTVHVPTLGINIYPNPMQNTANIEINSDKPIEEHNPQARIYNMKGQLVKSISMERRSAQQLYSDWDGKDDNCRSVSSGIYFIRIESGGKSYVHKVMLVK